MLGRQKTAVRKGKEEEPAADDLAFSCSRRRFLPMLLREAIVTAGMLRGRPGFRLSDLGSLPDEQLATIRPVVNPAYEIRTENRVVSARDRRTGTALELFSLEDVATVALFNLFDGQHTLAEAGEQLAQALALDEGPRQGFSLARDLFLSLAGKLVCVPKDPLEPA